MRNREWQASLLVGDGREGVMWTTSHGGGTQGAGIYGDPDALENIDAFVELKKIWDKNAPPYTTDIIDLTTKIVKALDNIDGEPPSGYTDDKNKPADNLDAAIQTLNKMFSDETPPNSKTDQNPGIKPSYVNPNKPDPYNIFPDGSEAPSNKRKNQVLLRTMPPEGSKPDTIIWKKEK